MKALIAAFAFAAAVVASAPVVGAASNYQGLWWNPSESGWGINFAHQADTIFATWFTYDDAGKPWWLIAVLHPSGPGYSGEVATVTGPPFYSAPWEISKVAETPVGTMTVTFTSDSEATLSYTVNGSSQVKPIRRQAFGELPICVWGQEDPAAANNYQDLWWNPPHESGWGINLTHQGDTIFATWFTYDTSGKPWWLIALLQRSDDGVYAGEVSTVTGPAFSAVPFNPAAVVETVVGSAEIDFIDGNTAVFKYTVSGISQTKAITRQIFDQPGTVCRSPSEPLFEIGTSARALLLLPNTTQDVYVTISPTRVFSDAVSLSASGSPVGTSLQLLPDTVNVGTQPVTAILRVTVDPAAVATVNPGTVTIHAQGSGGGSVEATLSVAVASPGDPIATRLRALTDVEKRFDELMEQGSTPLDWLQQLSNFMATHPAYARAGVDMGTMTAWGHFKDGTFHAIVANRTIGPNVTTATQRKLARKDARVPATTTARLLQRFGPRSSESIPVHQMRKALSSRGWTVRVADADIGTLKDVKNDGFFYINTHSGPVDDPLEPGAQLYAIQSSTLKDPDYEELFEEDLAMGRIGHMTTHERYLPPLIHGITNPRSVSETRYGITYRFVDKYMHFAEGSIVLINACYSIRPFFRFARAFVDKKEGAASVYVGWTQTVFADAANEIPPLFVDRLVGANQHEIKESPPQRAFAYLPVLKAMFDKGLTTDKVKAEWDVEPAKLQYIAKENMTSEPILAPSIRSLEVDERNDRLTIRGEFGTGEARVFVGGKQLAPLLARTADIIQVALPLTGAGANGDVVVEVRGVKSNARPLTAWSIPLKYSWIGVYGGAQNLNGTGTLRIRADIGGYRLLPGGALTYEERAGLVTRDSSLTITASGSYLSSGCTITYSGTNTYPTLASISGAAIFGSTRLDAVFDVNGESRQGALGLTFSHGPVYPYRYTHCSGSSSVASNPTMGFALDAPFAFPYGAFPVPYPAVFFTLDSNYGIPARSATAKDVSGKLTVSWEAVEALSPPRDDPDAGR